MSGPKCVEIGPDPRTLERERNHTACQTALSELGRLRVDWRRLASRLKDLDLTLEPPMRDTDEVETHVRSLLAGDGDGEAARDAISAANKWRSAVTQAEERLTLRIIDLQSRFRRAAERREALIRTRANLVSDTRSSALGSWPARVQQKLRELVDETLAIATEPTAVEPALCRDAIGALKKAEREIDAAEQAVARGRQSILDLFEQTQGEALASALTGDSANSATIDQWVQAFSPAHPKPSEQDRSAEKIERLLACVGALTETSAWENLLQEAEQVRLEPNLDRRRLLFENLSVACSVKLNHLRDVRRQREAAGALLDRTAAWASPEVNILRSELEQIRTKEEIVSLVDVENRLNGAISRERSRRESLARRQAIIDSLQCLGYATVEGLGTANVQEGRLVFQRTDEDEYAVEVVTSDDTSLVQTSLVRFAEVTDPSQKQRLRDREKEEAWCGDHSAFREQLIERGWQPRLTIALKPGERPVRVVSNTGRDRNRREMPQLRTRRMPNT